MRCARFVAHLLAASLGIAAVSNTVAVVCSDRVLAAFEQMPPPRGVSVEKSADQSHGCMARTPPRKGGVEGLNPSRTEFTKHGRSVVSDDDEGLVG